MSVADWDNEYARLARIASQLRTVNSNSNNNSNNNNNNNNNVRITLQNDLQNLERVLETNLISVLQSSEIQRRKRLLQNLLQQTIGSTNGYTSTSTVSSSGTNTNTNTNTTPYPKQTQTQLQQALQQQDDMIDNLATGMGRLKNQTIAIGDEARLHVNLLNDMESNLDIAHDSLQQQTNRAAQLREDQSVWRLQLIVAALFILLILLIFLGLTP